MATSTGTLLTGFGLALGAVAVGVWAVRGGGGHHMRGFGGARRRRGLSGRRTTRQLRGPTEIRELQLFVENDGDLYRQQMQPIQKNLITKMAKGVYDRTKAEKLWMYLVESGAKKYSKDYGGNEPGEWHRTFSIADRREVAKKLNDHFVTEAELHNYDYLLPKKYQKRA